MSRLVTVLGLSLGLGLGLSCRPCSFLSSSMKQPLHKLEEGGTNDGNMADQGDDGSPNPTNDLRSENHSDNQRHHNSYNVTYYYVSIQLSHQKYYQPITSRIPNLQEHSYFFGVLFKHVKHSNVWQDLHNHK
jgi:hypothetical protein